MKRHKYDNIIWMAWHSIKIFIWGCDNPVYKIESRIKLNSPNSNFMKAGIFNYWDSDKRSVVIFKRIQIREHLSPLNGIFYKRRLLYIFWIPFKSKTK